MLTTVTKDKSQVLKHTKTAFFSQTLTERKIIIWQRQHEELFKSI